MKFQYRFVDFGTRFRASSGQRASAADSPEQLFSNELAVDVGGVCWGLDGEQRAIVDHHFYREDQYPSASAAVLHLAGRIHERFASPADGVVWLVSHRQPDFDAFTSMFLARGVIEGTVPHEGWAEQGILGDGWQRDRRAINWFAPHTVGLLPQRRWPVLLAANASCVDNCRPLGCPRHRALHSILYAALLRGRDYTSTASGAVEFFDEVRRALSRGESQLNPLFDSVLESSEAFAPELSLLDRQVEAYERDIKRSRRCVVYLARSTAPFGEWFGALSATPLLDAGSSGLYPREEHLRLHGHRRRQADGICLRDPQCLLFKEWVRNDTDNSSMGEGFLFSAIAYSDACPGAAVNSSSYYFALDPERASQRHLYNVWARVQTAEAEALKQQRASHGDGSPPPPCRPGFEARAGARYASLFDDPWFDGGSYECTIVVSPSRGSAIGAPGRASDLSDDPVAQIVQHELELGFLEGDIAALDLPTSRAAGAAQARTFTVADVLRGAAPLPAAGSYRFARVALAEDVQTLEGKAAEQIGRLLWRLIDTEGAGSVPPDFLERHLVRKADWIGVWSRYGVVMACKLSATESAAAAQRLLCELSDLSSGIESLIQRPPTDAAVLAEGESLMRRVAQAKHDMATPEAHLVRRFFDASRLDEVLATLRDINQASLERSQRSADRDRLAQQQQIAAKMDANVQRITRIQSAIHVIEYVVAVTYCVELWEAFVRGNEHYEHGKLEAGQFISNHLEPINWGNWLHVFTYFHWDLLLPASLGFGLVVAVNYAVEGHCAEWQWIKRLFGFGRNKPHG